MTHPIVRRVRLVQEYVLMAPSEKKAQYLIDRLLDGYTYVGASEYVVQADGPLRVEAVEEGGEECGR